MDKIEILKDFSAAALATAMEANMLEFWVRQGSVPQVDVRDDPDMKRFVTGIPHPVFNGVLSAQLAPHEADSKVDETLAYFGSRRLPMCWAIGPSTRPADLGTRLAARGLIHTDSSPGMAVDLLELKEHSTAPGGLTIRLIDDARTLRTWTHTANDVFGLSGPVGDACSDLLANVGFGLPCRYYIGLLQGEPVATSLLFLGGGVAGIYWVATVPERRGQGIGTAITLAPLRQARDMGYRIGILQSSQMALNLYRQLEFEEYCRFDFYIMSDA